MAKCDTERIAEIVVESPRPYEIIVEKKITLPIVEVQVPGIQGPEGPQGPPGESKPLEIDPLEIYLKARGDMYGNS